MKVQFNFKIEEKDLKSLQKIADARDECVSDIVRLSVRKELARFGLIKTHDVKMLEV